MLHYTSLVTFWLTYTINVRRKRVSNITIVNLLN